MRILYCIPHLYNSGGMERVLTQKVNWLMAHTQHAITILTTEPTPPGVQESYFALDSRVGVVSLNIDFNADYNLPLGSKWLGHMRRMRAYRRALAHYVRTEHIDLCISLGGKEIAFLHHLPCRTMAEIHFAQDQRRQLLMANHSGWFWSLLGHIRTRQLVRAVRPLERLVVLTNEDKASWEASGCTNVVCIPNPCSLDGVKMPVSSKKKMVLAVGRLHEQKGFDLLLEAWRSIEPQYSDWCLRIVGEGHKRAELEAQIARLGLQGVVLAGSSAEMAKEYAQAALFVLSSRYEGLPLALIEAMWCGVPCVSFDCPHGPAALLAEERGWLVPCGDVSALAQQIVFAISHSEEAAARAKRAQAYAQQRYSEAAIMPQWVQLIDNG